MDKITQEKKVFMEWEKKENMEEVIKEVLNWLKNTKEYNGELKSITISKAGKRYFANLSFE